MSGVSHFALFPESASTMASRVDSVTTGLLALSAAIMLVVFGLIAVFGVLYHEGSPRPREIRPRGQNALEWGWSVLTLVTFLGLFFWGASAYLRMRSEPAGALEISVVAKQWMWKFQHPDGKRELDELHVPLGQPVVLNMTSQDVIHSFFVPEFRVKQDVLPGRYTRVWFEATRPGEYHLFCTQYCGLDHARMRGRVIAMTPADYQRWLGVGVAGATPSMADRGGRLFTRLGCVSCHGASSAVKAPSLHGLYGKPAHLSDGTTVVADDSYLRESILNPRARIVEGYPAIMPTFVGIASEEDVLDLIAYLKTLQGTPKQSEAP